MARLTLDRAEAGLRCGACGARVVKWSMVGFVLTRFPPAVLGPFCRRCADAVVAQQDRVEVAKLDRAYKAAKDGGHARRWEQ